MLCSRALPPPEKNASSVCAASCTTQSPSMRPGHPRSSASSRGVNMQNRNALGLRVDDHVGDAGMLVANARLDLARARVCVGERGSRVEAECEERHEPLGRLQEPQLPRLAADLLAHDPPYIAGLDAAGL